MNHVSTPGVMTTQMRRVDQGRSTNVASMRLLPLAAPGSAVSGGTVGPLALGEGEPICGMAPGGVENPHVTAPVVIQGVSRHPTGIASFGGDHCCVALLPSAPHGESICDFSEDGVAVDYLMPAVPATTSGVTEVVAMAEVSVICPFCTQLMDVY